MHAATRRKDHQKHPRESHQQQRYSLLNCPHQQPLQFTVYPHRQSQHLTGRPHQQSQHFTGRLHQQSQHFTGRPHQQSQHFSCSNCLLYNERVSRCRLWPDDCNHVFFKKSNFGSIFMSITRALNLSCFVVSKECLTVILVTMLLITSSADAYMLNSKNRFVSRSLRSERAASGTSLQHPNPATSPPTYDLTSTHPSLSSSSSFSSKDDIPGISQSSPTYSQEKETDSSGIFTEPTTRSQLIALLISTLQKLNVLNSKSGSCFRLVKIVHTSHDQTSSPYSSSSTSSKSSPNIETTNSVYLHFQELPHGTADSANISSGEHVNTSSNSESVTMLHNICNSDPVVEVPMTNVKSLNKDSKTRNVSLVFGNQEISSSSTGLEDILQSGLSRTQIVVISTCSAIIGMFFLIAGFLRIRNYIKRSRLEQELARRPKFRSCSVALRGATQSLEQLRRDSMTSKTSHQNSLTTQGSNGSNLHGSPSQDRTNTVRPDPDTAPLLLNIRALHPVDLASPTESHASLKFIDEEPRTHKRKGVPPTTVNKNNDLVNCSTTELGPTTRMSAEDSTSLKVRSVAAPSSTVFSKTSKRDGQVITNQEGVNVNPSFSSGSISCQLMVKLGTPDVGLQKTISCNTSPNKKAATDPEDISREFSKLSITDPRCGKRTIKPERECDDLSDVETDKQLPVHCSDNTYFKNVLARDGSLGQNTVDVELSRLNASPVAPLLYGTELHLPKHLQNAKEPVNFLVLESVYITPVDNSITNYESSEIPLSEVPCSGQNIKEQVNTLESIYITPGDKSIIFYESSETPLSEISSSGRPEISGSLDVMNEETECRQISHCTNNGDDGSELLGTSSQRIPNDKPQQEDPNNKESGVSICTKSGIKDLYTKQNNTETTQCLLPCVSRETDCSFLENENVDKTCNNINNNNSTKAYADSSKDKHSTGKDTNNALLTGRNISSDVLTDFPCPIHTMTIGSPRRGSFQNDSDISQMKSVSGESETNGSPQNLRQSTISWKSLQTKSPIDLDKDLSCTDIPPAVSTELTLYTQSLQKSPYFYDGISLDRDNPTEKNPLNDTRQEMPNTELCCSSAENKDSFRESETAAASICHSQENVFST